MKLYEVTVFDDSEEYTQLVVAKSEKEAEDKIYNMDCWSCIITVIVKEIDLVDGYRVKLEKDKDEESYDSCPTGRYKKELNKMTKEDLSNIEKLLEEE